MTRTSLSGMPNGTSWMTPPWRTGPTSASRCSCYSWSGSSCGDGTLMVFAALMAAATMLLSMGAYLHVDGHRTHVPLPFIVLAHLPLLDSGSASRYVSLFWLFAALILVMTLDGCTGPPCRGSGRRVGGGVPHRRRGRARAAGAGVALPRRCGNRAAVVHEKRGHCRRAPRWWSSRAPTPATPPPCCGRRCRT